MADAVDDYLEHFGVKGMKWGKRQAHTEKRRDYKARIKQERTAHDQKHLSNVLTTSAKRGEDVLVKTMMSGSYAPTIMTGKQFVQMAGSGALLNARTTDIFAAKDNASGKYVLNDKPNTGYKPSARR